MTEVKDVKKKKKKRIPEDVACVYCNGGDRCAKKYEYDESVTDCIQALEVDPEGNLECQYGCLGLGTCVQKCPVKAIHINEHHVAEIDYEKCINCGICIKKCPRNIIGRHKRYETILPLCSNKSPAKEARKVCKVSCIACKMCERACPAGAIVVTDNLAQIDDELCLVCGMCVTVCPRKLIKDVDGIILV